MYRRYRTAVKVDYDTAPGILEIFVAGIQEILAKHPYTLDEKTQVSLTEFGESSVDIMLHTFIDVDAWDKELKTKQEVILAVLKLAEAIGVRISRTNKLMMAAEKKEEGQAISPKEARRQMEEFLKEYEKSLEE